MFVKEDRVTRKVAKKPCLFIAKFHYTGPTRARHGPDRTRSDPNGPARTLSETRTDPTEFRRKKVRVGPVGSVSGPSSGI